MQLLNHTAIREFTFQVLAANRPHLAEKKTRISKEYLDRLEAKIRAVVINEVETMNSVGATIK